MWYLIDYEVDNLSRIRLNTDFDDQRRSAGWRSGGHAEKDDACARTHWKAPPCHGAHVKQTLRIATADRAMGRTDRLGKGPERVPSLVPMQARKKPPPAIRRGTY
jgi:hypothetical protein